MPQTFDFQLGTHISFRFVLLVYQVPGFIFVGSGVCKDSQGNVHDYYSIDLGSTSGTPDQCGTKCLDRADSWGLVGFQLDYSRYCYCLYDNGVDTSGGVNSRTGTGEIASANSDKECYKVVSLCIPS